jgi:hypothetical protein
MVSLLNCATLQEDLAPVEENTGVETEVAPVFASRS